jgi:hypothetical protein
MTRISPEHWNGWHLDAEIPALTYDTEHFHHYQLDLDRMLTADDIMFWVIQVGGKPWPGALNGFVNAIDDLLDPHRQMNTVRQAGAEERPERSYTAETIRTAVAEFVSTEIRHYSKWVSPAEAGRAS